MDQWPDVKVTKGLQWLTWVCQQCALKDKGVEACKSDLPPILSETQSIFSFLSRPYWVSCPSKLDCLVDANGFNPAIYCGLENNLWLLAWVILDNALLLVIVFASGIVHTVSHQPGPPFNKLASHTLWRQIVFFFYNLCHWLGPCLINTGQDLLGVIVVGRSTRFAAASVDSSPIIRKQFRLKIFHLALIHTLQFVRTLCMRTLLDSVDVAVLQMWMKLQ